MKKISVALPFLFLIACKSNTTSPLVGEWQAVSLQNPQVDAILEQQKMLLDTMTQLPEAPSYGMAEEIKSLDTFKARGYRELDVMRQYYNDAATETKFTFRKDSVAILTFPQGSDSARYSLEGDSVLVLNERALKSVGEERLAMRIGKLTADSLTLIVPDANNESVMRFRKVK